MTQAINLANFSNNLDSSGGLNPNALNAPTPISKGGTGASTVAAAIANLGPSIYPVGSIYLNANTSTNPATLLGFGTWVAFGAGRVPVGFSSGDPLFGTAGNTGGNRDATLPSHTHTATSSVTDPGHTHSTNAVSLGLKFNGVADGYPYSNTLYWPSASINSATTGISVSTSVASAGSSATNANLPPYITVYMWQRTA